MFTEELSQARQKTSKVLVKNCFIQIHLTDFNVKKICVSNGFIKMFIKRKTKADYEMIVEQCL